ncbi:hypothetical protein D3C80_1166730 [compost metagenome]
MIQTLKPIFVRDLQKLKTEIESYQHEKNIWLIKDNVSNSAGNLCLHLMGNLNHFIGATLGNSGYVRNRDLEFVMKDVPQAELISKIEDTIKAVEAGLDQVKEDQLKNDYPLVVFGEKTSIEFMLLHLITHLSYHLGQINYHRRLLDK